MLTEETKTIKRIAIRASGLTKGKYDLLTVSMDITACHEANSLNLEKLLAFNDSDFLHDVAGINRHLDHETSELKDCFWPRCGSQ